MKDIYELLNDHNIDDNEFEEMEVTEFEKAKVKSALKKSITKKKKRMGWKMNVAAAVIVLGLSTTTLALSFPAYASNIPIIGDIFKFLDSEKTGFYDGYKEYSTELNMVQESKGIKITINDAVFDGKTVAVTYSIESDRDLGEDLVTDGMLDVKGPDEMTGSSYILKIDNYHYVGLDKITLYGFTSGNIDINWKPGSIHLLDIDEKIKGNWKFAFSLKATDNQVQLSNQSVEDYGVTVNIEKIAFTPMSFIFSYNQKVTEQVKDKWDGAEVELEVKDDLGNVYLGEGNGGSGKDIYTMRLTTAELKLRVMGKKKFLSQKKLALREKNL